MQSYAIQTERLTKTYGSLHALKQVSIHVRQGCIYGLIGDNGAGKSTLLKILAGISFPSGGELRIGGKFEEKDLKNARRHMGCIVEQPGFFPGMTVEQTLVYYCIQKGIPNRDKIPEMLNLTGLEAKRRSKCKNLSLGQKQRLGLAIAMLGEPRILVLDEPINGLDPSGIIEIRNLLHRLNEEKNITILLSSHILAELQQTATIYGFLNNGVLLEEISAKALSEKCADCIEITVPDIRQYSMFFEKEFPRETFRVFPDNRLLIYKPLMSAENYSRLAADHGIYITGMQTLKTSLADYYMQLKKQAGSQAEFLHTAGEDVSQPCGPNGPDSPDFPQEGGIVK